MRVAYAQTAHAHIPHPAGLRAQHTQVPSFGGFRITKFHARLPPCGRESL